MIQGTGLLAGFIIGTLVVLIVIAGIAVPNWGSISHWLTTEKDALTAISPFVAIVGLVATMVFTPLGWSKALDNSRELEREKNINALKWEQRKAALQRISDQLRLLYGPLMSLVETRQAAMDQLVYSQRPNAQGYFDGSRLPPEQLTEWRRWRKEVFLPLLVKMEEVVINNSHLIEPENASTDSLPEHFRDLLGHVATYKAIIKRWDEVIEKDKIEGTHKINQWKEVSAGRFEPVIPHTAQENFSEKFKKAIKKSMET